MYDKSNVGLIDTAEDVIANGSSLTSIQMSCLERLGLQTEIAVTLGSPSSSEWRVTT